MKNKKTLLAAAVLVIILIALGLFRGIASSGGKDSSADSAGEEKAKAIAVTVVHGDGSEKVFEYDTDETYLAPVLTEEGLVEGTEGQYGLFITTVDGEEADESKEEWWCITEDGEPSSVSASELEIEDGDKFELTMTVGY